MNDFNFVQWLSIVTPIVTLTGAMYYNMKDDMKQLGAHHREDVNNMFNLWKENQERWVQSNLRIEQILSRMDKSEK